MLADTCLWVVHKYIRTNGPAPLDVCVNTVILLLSKGPGRPVEKKHRSTFGCYNAIITVFLFSIDCIRITSA